MQLTPAKKAAPTYRDGFFILATFFSHYLVVDGTQIESRKALQVFHNGYLVGQAVKILN